jgi:hypothetical protein
LDARFKNPARKQYGSSLLINRGSNAPLIPFKMKSFITILLIACLGFSLQAQSTTRSQVITTPLVFTVFGGAQDTIKKGSATSVYDFYTINIKDFCKQSIFKVKAVRTAGTYTKARFVMQKSLDGNTWENVDSVAFAGTGATQYATGTFKTDIYRPIMRFKAYAYDTVQVVKYQYTILIDK